MDQCEDGWECQEVQHPITVSFVPLPEALDHAPILAAEEVKAGPPLLLLAVIRLEHIFSSLVCLVS